MFMPRAASRILLEITDIELKQLRAITTTEAIAEGIEEIFYDEYTSATGWKNYLSPDGMCCRARDSFSRGGTASTVPARRKMIPGCG